VQAECDEDQAQHRKNPERQTDFSESGR